MSIGLTEDLRDLADSVRRWADRAAPLERTRAGLPGLSDGGPDPSWDSLVSQGLHALHLPEEHGGAGAGLTELAVVAEQLAQGLHPGPFGPTVVASATLAAAPAGAVRDTLLARFADGATGVCVTDGGLHAEESDQGWRVRGTSAPVVGLPGAEIVLVRADTATGRDLWFRLPGDADRTRCIETLPATDLTRSAGRLVLDDTPLVVTAQDTFHGPSRPAGELARATVLGAEASGVAQWSLATAVEHVRTREQFGVPVGSFQAVQHRAATMLVDAETIRAAAWDAARAEGADPLQQELAAAQVGASALPRAVDVAMACVSLLGGIGFTWEHDVHLYWRRALALTAQAGDEPGRLRALGAAATRGRRDFEVVTDTELPALRREIGEILDRAAAAPDDALPARGWAPARGGTRQRILADHGLVAPHYPAPWGRGAGVREQAVIAQEYARRSMTPPSTVIGEWVLPTLLTHGTPAQHERFVTPTLRGDLWWCQLFSEPGAGSDLASLSTRARKVDGGWVLTGQKVWTSMAAEADWGVCLARTDPDAPRHAGLSYFLVDMRSPGVEVRPLVQATGQAEFNEVFLTDVLVPDDCLVAAPGDGWRLAGTTLTNERLSMGGELGHGSSSLVRRVIAEGTHGADDDAVLEVLGRCTAREMSLQALNLRSALARRDGLEPGAGISVQKVLNALAQRDNSRDLVRVLGPWAALATPPPDHAHDPVIDHLGLPAVLFGGGTVEIQLNVIARRVLGLPR